MHFRLDCNKPQFRPLNLINRSFPVDLRHVQRIKFLAGGNFQLEF
jgi:hypothetical protein